MCSREIFTKKCRQKQIFDSDLKGAWHYNHVTFTPIAKHFTLYCRLIYMLSILCVRLTIKVKVGIPESFKVGWYPPQKKLGRVTLTEGFLRYRFGGLIFGGAYTWRGLFSEFYGRLFQSSPGPLFQNEGRCSAFDLEIIFHSHANKTHFQKKGCAPSLILKVRVFGVRKWPILGSKKNGVGRVFLLRHLAQHSRARRHF